MMEERILELEKKVRELEARIAVWLAVHSEQPPIALGVKDAETKD